MACSLQLQTQHKRPCRPAATLTPATGAELLPTSLAMVLRSVVEPGVSPTLREQAIVLRFPLVGRALSTRKAA